MRVLWYGQNAWNRFGAFVHAHTRRVPDRLVLLGGDVVVVVAVVAYTMPDINRVLTAVLLDRDAT